MIIIKYLTLMSSMLNLVNFNDYNKIFNINGYYKKVNTND